MENQFIFSKNLTSIHYGSYTSDGLEMDKETNKKLNDIIHKLVNEGKFLKITYTFYEGENIVKEYK